MIVLLGLFLLTACSSDTYESEIALEAHWQCDVQRLAFAELEDMTVEFESRLAAEGVTSDRYADFEGALEESPDLRAEVLDAYDQYCVVADD